MQSSDIRNEHVRSLVDFSGECWRWKGTKFKTGYGYYLHNGQVRSAASVVREECGLEVREKENLQPTCGNSWCVNPCHKLYSDEVALSKIKVSETGCHEYQGQLDEAGYGIAYVDGRTWRMNRWFWQRTHGPIPGGLFVLHKCNNPRCCNPDGKDHLYLGDQKRNMLDKVESNRQAKGGTHGSKTKPESVRKGSDNHASKISEADVVKIRKLAKEGILTLDQMGEQFSVIKTCISAIIHGKTWKQAGGPLVAGHYKPKNQVFKKGSSHKSSKLEDSDVLEIRRLAKEGATKTELAKRYGMDQTTMSDIVLGRSWTHLPCDSQSTNSRPNKTSNGKASKLSEDQVREIRRLHQSGEANKNKLKNDFGVSFATITKIVNRETFKHLS